MLKRPLLALACLGILAADCGRAPKEAGSAAGETPRFASANANVVYVGSWHGVVPVSAASGSAGNPIGGRWPPYGMRRMAITPNGATIYVVRDAHAVVPFSTATGRVGKPIPVVYRPDLIAMSPDGKTAYVAGASTALTPINTATGIAGKPFPVERARNFPVSITITPDGKTAYVRNIGSVVPVNLATRTIGKPIITNSEALALAITPNGRTVYIDGSDHTVIPISTATNTPGKPINLGHRRGWPSWMAVTPDSRTMYVAEDDGVVPISTASETAGRLIKAGSQPNFIAVTPDGRTAYVTSRNAVYAISTATNTATKVFHLPGFIAAQVVVTADGRTAWVSGLMAGGHGRMPHGVLVPISTTGNRAGKPVNVGAIGLCLVTAPWRSGSARGPSSCL